MKSIYFIISFFIISICSCSKTTDCNSYYQTSAGAINAGQDNPCQWSSYVFYCINSTDSTGRNIFPLAINVGGKCIDTLYGKILYAPLNCDSTLPDSFYVHGSLTTNAIQNWTAKSLVHGDITFSGTIYSNSQQCQMVQIH